MKHKIMAAYFIAGALEAALAAVSLATIPTDGKNALLFGFSFSRLIMLAAALGAAVAMIYAARDAWGGAPWTRLLSEGVRRRLESGGALAAALLGCTGLAGAAGYLAYLVDQGRFGMAQASLERLQPFTLWTCLFALHSLLFLIWCNRNRAGWPNDPSRKQVTLLSLGGVLVALAGASFVRFTGIGIIPDVVAWGAAGTPLLFWQVLATLAAVGALLCVFLVFPWRPKKGDLISAALLWLLAFAFWGLTPLKPSYFAPAPVPPNMAYYPYSDAALHDTIAQNLLVGEGLGGHGGKVVRRPLYALFLAGLHALTGQDYDLLSLVQAGVLALLPGMMYLLGASVHSRAAGWMAGLLFAFQEHNAIALSGVINVAHARLLMSDLPSALVISVFCLLVLRSLRAAQKDALTPLLAGGALGAAMLIRPQAFVLAAAAILAYLLMLRARREERLRSILFFCLGLLLCVTPWIVRNWGLTGGFVFDEPSEAQIGMVARRYSLDPYAPESHDGEDAPQGADAYADAMTGRILGFVLSHPDEVARFSSAHFMHNLANLAALLPLSPEILAGETYVRTHPFWLDPAENPQALPPFANLPLFLVNLALLGIGVGSALAGRSGLRWFALFPLLAYLAYNLSNALARNSGWRFLLPGDWVMWIYFACGLAQVLLWIAGIFAGSSLQRNWFAEPISAPAALELRADTADHRRLIVGAAFILLLGASFSLVEALIPPRYTPRTSGEMLASLASANLNEQQRAQLDILSGLAETGGVSVVQGRALYPRFYRAGRGITAGSPSTLTTPMDFPRLTFGLVGPLNANVVLPLGSPPDLFPHAADVILAGCYDRGRFNAFLVGGQDFLYEQDVPTTAACPVSTQN